MKKPTQHCLTSDNEGHWYVIPAHRKEEFDAWIDSLNTYDCDSEEDVLVDFCQELEQPDWAIRVGGAPSNVKFTGYVIE
jgi:hypothetical protein